MLNCCSCGLAVLAMAARSILACEVVAGSAADVDGTTNDGTDELCNKVHNVEKNQFSKHLYPPTLADLQDRAIAKGFSGRGEMFSAKAMACLAAEHQSGRYKAYLVEKSTQSISEDINHKSSGDSFNGSCCNLVEDFTVTNSNEHKIQTTKLGLSTWITNIVERLMNGNLIAIW